MNYHFIVLLQHRAIVIPQLSFKKIQNATFLFSDTTESELYMSSCLRELQFTKDARNCHKQVCSRGRIGCLLFDCRGKVLELLRPDNNGRVQTVCSEEVFGIIRCLSTFRLVGAARDYLIIGSDSGRIVILEFDAKINRFIRVHQETFGKSGCRRIVPGEFIAVDPQGRACMIGAVEKQKFVYILNRDPNQRLTISSPLEAHRAHTILFSLVGLDVGFDNPLFASIETNYHETNTTTGEESSGDKMFTIYEMDLGINHVVRKYAEPVPMSAHLLIPVTGGSDGPGGCIVCCDSTLLYKKLGRETIACDFPKRVDCPSDKPVMVVSYAKHKSSLLLVQTELGDLFKVDLERTSSNGIVTRIRMSYLDTIPRANSLCILRSGFLFAASEFGDHALYQINASAWTGEEDQKKQIIFTPNSDQLTSLELFDQLPSLCPLTDLKQVDKELFAITGRSSTSFLKKLSFGVPVSEMASSALPGKPSGVWSISNDQGLQDKYIIISFVDATLVLAVGETVQEVADAAGLLPNVSTLHASKMTDNSLIQIHPRGLRHVHEATGKVAEWRAPGGRQVIVGTANSTQVVLALTGGDLVYFELISETLSVQEIAKRDMGSEISSISLMAVEKGRARALFMAVSGSDRSVRVLSLEPDKLLKQLSAQSYQVAVESTLITMDGFLSIGLANGTLVRCCLDKVTGVLTDPRNRFLGIRPVRLCKIFVEKRECVLALSSKPWIVDPLTVGTAPLAHSGPIETAASFNSDQCPEGFVGIAGDLLKIIGIDRLGSKTFAEESSLSLNYTGRKIVQIPNISGSSSSAALAVLEAQHNSFPESKREKLIENLQLEGEQKEIGRAGTAGKGQWASCVEIIDPTTLSQISRIEMENNECAVSVSVAHFYQLKDNRPCLLVACAKDLEIIACKRSASESFIKTFLYNELFVPQLVHVTPVETPFVPLAMCAFEGRLLVSLTSPTGGCFLRLYELGKKRLLKKTQYRNNTCGGFHSIQVVKDRIFAADVFNSILVLKLNKVDGQLFVVCDDIGPRYVSAMLALDYNTVIGGDKFDNIFANRIPIEVREDSAGTGEATLGSGGLRLGPDTSYILGKNHKLEPVNHFHLGELVTSMQKTCLSPGSSEVILYSTINGSIGALYPFLTKKEYELFLGLESHMRNALGSSLVGRDHCAFRSYYLPTKGVVDGDLVAGFSKLPNKSQIAQLVGKSVNEIEKIIEEIHNRIT